MKIEIDTDKMMDADDFGEFFRDYIFDKKGNKDLYGCYSTFDVKEEFKSIEKNSELWKELFEYFGYSKQYLVSEPDKHIEDMTTMYSNGNIHVAWYWDGDGVLVIKEGDRVIINHDCKKTYRWEWIKLSGE